MKTGHPFKLDIAALTETQKQFAVAEFGQLINHTCDDIYEKDSPKREEYIKYIKRHSNDCLIDVPEAFAEMKINL